MKPTNSIFPAGKIMLLALVLMCCTRSSAQTSVYADPALISFDITDQNDVSVPDADNLYNNTVYRLKLSLQNLDQLTAVPPGTCVIRIGLGTKMKLNPAFNLVNAAFSNYFAWTSTTSMAGVTQINGAIIAPLPADFIAELSFDVRSALSTPSGGTVAGNFLIPNDNPLYYFSDLNPSNNTGNISFTFTGSAPLPVTITKFAAANQQCSINAEWAVGEEINVARYELQWSKDGKTYETGDTKNAQNLREYKSSFPVTEKNTADVLLLRLKITDKDGSYKLSSIVTVKGNCKALQTGSLGIFPNPVIQSGSLNIISKKDFFTGVYDVRICDRSGKTVQQKTMMLTGTSAFKVDVNSNLPAGIYTVILSRQAGTEKQTVQFEKL